MHTPILEEVVLRLPFLHLARRGTNSRTSPISANDNMAEHRGEYNSFLWPSPTSARGCRFGRSLPIFVLGYPVSTHETAEPPQLSSDGQEPSVGFLSRDTSLPLGKQSLGVPHPLPARLQSLPASGWPWDTAVASRAEPCRAEPCRTAPSVGAAAENFSGSFRAVRAHRTVQTRSVLAAPTLVTRRACAGCGTDALRDRHVAGSLPAPSRLRGRPSAGHRTAAAQTRGLRRGAAAVAARSRTGRDGDGGGSGRRAASRVSSAPSPCTRAEWLNV